MGEVSPVILDAARGHLKTLHERWQRLDRSANKARKTASHPEARPFQKTRARDISDQADQAKHEYQLLRLALRNEGLEV